jgi:Xaa-Pro aminopeptidase
VTRDRFAHRRARAAAMLQAAGLETLLVTPGPDLRYLTGYDPLPLERLTVLVLDADGSARLVVPALEAPGASGVPGMDGVGTETWRDGEDPHALAARLLRPGAHAITDRSWSSHLLALQEALPSARFVPAGRSLPLLRAVKDADEIAALREAGRGADAASAGIVASRFAGRTEREVAAELARLLREHGHERVDFTIVGSGENAASPHHDPTDRTIGEGDVVVMDFGGIAGGYASDITRTVVVGEPTTEQREVYEVVRAAQQRAFESIRPGALAQDVDRAARAVIADAGYGERFIHRTGHGIGLEVHEPPYIVEGDETVLEPGMTFSDEPGIYLPGRFGVRIEDQVVVTPDGAERLNEAPRELTVVA